MRSIPSRDGGDGYDGRMLAATAAAAGTDAITYLGLGHVFTANMTGNTVLLGIGVATGDFAAAWRAATALGGFVAAAVAVGVAQPGRGWSRGVLAALVAEVALLAALAAWWSTLPPHPTGGPRYGLIVLSGAAMGTQSAAVRQLGVPSVTTTYITGTWTTLSTTVGAWLRRAHRPEHRRALRRQAGVVVVYPLSALAVAAAFVYWRSLAALIPVGLLALVLAWSLVKSAGRRAR